MFACSPRRPKTIRRTWQLAFNAALLRSPRLHQSKRHSLTFSKPVEGNSFTIYLRFSRGCAAGYITFSTSWRSLFLVFIAVRSRVNRRISWLNETDSCSLCENCFTFHFLISDNCYDLDKPRTRVRKIFSSMLDCWQLICSVQPGH